MSKRRLLIAAFFAAATTPLVSHADDVPDSVAAHIKAQITAHTAGQVHVEQIAVTPIQGIYEVLSGQEIFYTDATGRYSLVGASLMDMQSRQDLTALRLEERMSIPFDRLPLQHAIKETRGNGSQVFAVFEDPNCPVCRVFTKFLDQLDNVTVYKFMFPVISPQSASLARMAWCANDRHAVWQQLMAGNRPQLSEQCNTDGLVEILALGERYQITNTPTVVLANGKRLVGALPPEQFLQELQHAGQPGEQR